MTGARLHILMTADAVGGVWTYATTLARALAAPDCAVTVVTLGPRPDVAQRAALADCEAIRLIETDLELEWRDPGGCDAARARASLAAIARECRPDVVHVNGFREALAAWSSPVLVVAHSCVNTWAAACGAEADFRTAAWRAYSEAVERGLRRADVWVAPTAALRNAIARHYDVPPGQVIHNGLSAAPSSIAVKDPVVLAAGRAWDRAKNLDVLDAAATRVIWPLRIAGEGDHLVTHAHAATWLGALPHAATLDEMARAAIFVSLALYEPFGLAVLEAASAGCALVLSDIASFRELWHGAALFVPPDDADAIAAALNRLCGDAELRGALQREARERAGRYTATRMADAYRALYAGLAASARPPSRASRLHPAEELRA